MTTIAPGGPDVRTMLADNAHLVGGEWVPAADGGTIDVLNPANQDLLLRVPRGGPNDVDAAVRAAAAAFPAWRDTSPTVRAELLYAWAELLNQHAGELDAIESLEIGRPSWGPSPVGRIVRYVAGQADKVTGQTLPTERPGMFAMTIREPYGVCGSIIPWNTPTPLMTHDVAPALAAGNTVVVKPAEDAPLACLLMGKLAMAAGIPPGVVNIVTGYGHEAGAALPAHPLVRRMSFTGSPETGSRVMEACATNLVPLHLELGGKSPQVLLRDADLATAIPTIVGGIIFNSGQICAAGSRLLVEKSARKEVVGALAEAFRKVRVGPWYDNPDMGPLINASQQERVLGYFDVGREEGAEVVVGGHRLTGDKFDQGFFVEPTIFDQVRPDMRVAQEEIFGPVLSVISYSDEEEALAIANGTRYGLATNIWTNDLKRAVRLATGVAAGSVFVNTSGPFHGGIGLPFGGYKHSGFGRAQGLDSILEYTQIKSVVLNGN